MSTQPPTPSPARPTRPTAWTPLVFLAIAGASVVAAGVGGYVAQSHRQTELPTVEASPATAAAMASPAAAAPDRANASTPGRVPQASASPEASSPAEPEPAAAPFEAGDAAEPPAPARVASRAQRAPEPVERSRSRAPIPARAEPAAAATTPPRVQAQAPPTRSAEPAPAVEMPAPEPPVAEAEAPTTPTPVQPAPRAQSAQVSIAETFTIPADSVIGLEIEHSVSSETAQLEDRVDGRVTRDVKVDGTVVIPAGARVRGAVTRVENGGRFKERGRIEIRFHTLVLPGGETEPIETDVLFREGDNVGRKASTRIGASAAGGAIIGAIFGGERGAAIGAAAGAGAGTAVTAAQKPSEARFRAGSVVTIRLMAPVSITIQQ